MEQKTNPDSKTSKHQTEIDLKEISDRHKLQQKVLKKMIDQIKSTKKETESKNNKS